MGGGEEEESGLKRGMKAGDAAEGEDKSGLEAQEGKEGGGWETGNKSGTGGAGEHAARARPRPLRSFLTPPHCGETLRASSLLYSTQSSGETSSDFRGTG